MEFIDEIKLEKLQKNVDARNETLRALRKSWNELKAQQAGVKFDNDPCPDHVGINSFLKARYDYIIKNIEEMINVMENGEWCFSAKNTKGREEKELNYYELLPER